MRSSRSAVILTSLVAIAAVLAGCATPASPSGTGPNETAAPIVAEPDVVSGEGSTGFPGIAFPIPEDAKSVVITFECDGSDGFSVELGDSMALRQSPLGGTCGEPTDLAWPILPATGETLSVMVTGETAWSATPTFSTEEFAYDRELEADCTAFAAVYSALTNADSGFGHYGAFDETEWRARVDAATQDLAALAAASHSGIRSELESMSATLASDGVAGQSMAGVDDALGRVTAACNANQTPLVISAEFGG